MVDWKDSKDLLQNINRFPEFCERFLRIIPKTGGKLVPFKLNRVQRWYFKNYLAADWKADRPVRHCILKARQFGFTTLIQAFILWSTLGQRGRNSMVVASEEDQSKLIFEMIRRFDKHLPDDGEYLPIFPKSRDSGGLLEYNRPDIRHQKKSYKDNEDKLVYLDSRIRVYHASQQDKLGRAGTFHGVHASEVAFWADLTGSLSTVLSCVADEPRTVFILETTANGMNAFHRFWMDLQVEGAGDNKAIKASAKYWRKVFVPWYWSDEYVILPEPGSKHSFLDDYEEALYKRMKQDPFIASQITAKDKEKRIGARELWGRLLWRRFMIQEKFFGDTDRFKQEFPSTPAEAFMASGIPVFPPYVTARLEAAVKEPIWVGDVLPSWGFDEQGKRKEFVIEQPGGDVIQPPEKKDVAGRMFHAVWKEKPDGCLKVYEWPEPGHQYCVFADLAEGKGIDMSKKRHHGDYTAVQVLCVSKFPPVYQVAVWHGNMDPDQTGDLLVALAEKYNDAFLGWEVNGPGRSLALQIVDKHRYANIYMREDFDLFTQSHMKRPGWRTDRATKPHMVSVAKRFARMGDIVIPDEQTVTEMKAFSVLGMNQYGAAQGNDDLVISLCGALAIVEPYIASIAAKAKRMKELEEQRTKGIEPEPEPWDNQQGGSVWNPVLGSEW